MNVSFNKLDLRNKLIFITVLPIVLLSLLLLFLISYYQISLQRDALLRQSNSLTGVIAANLAPSVLFKDEDTSLQIMATLGSEASVIFARVQSNDKSFSSRFFAQEQSDYLEQLVDIPSYQQETFNPFSDYLVTSAAIHLNEELIGVIDVITDTSSIQKQVGIITLTFLSLIVLSAVVSFFVVKRFHNAISDPILKLRDIMQSVSHDNNYKVRANTNNDNYLRDLNLGFNHMLDQIEHRDVKLIETRDSLEREVMMRLLEIERINKKRISWLENLAFFLQHELRNKIVGFRSSLDLLERRSGDPKLEKYLVRARKSTTMMNHLLESVANASDLEATLWNEEKTIVNLSSVICDHVEESISNYSGQRFSTDITPNLYVLGNIFRIIQACEKLTENAVEHSKKDTDITVNLLVTNAYAELSFENSGGALPEDRDAIFQLFASANNQPGAHRGIGLFVVRAIIENHAGEVYAEPLEREEGARFVIRIPLLDERSYQEND